jgi:hypothetical protein
VNLYHELAKHLKIKVVFIGQGSSIRTKDFTPLEMKFDHVFLSDGAFEERNVFSTLFRLASFIFKTKYKKMVLGGGICRNSGLHFYSIESPRTLWPLNPAEMKVLRKESKVWLRSFFYPGFPLFLLPVNCMPAC